MKFSAFAKQWGASVLALLAGLLYAIQSWVFAHTQLSVLDEGAYLLKGLLFAQGRYAPFQDFGLLTNHMPLAFFIPGWAQLLFGEGLRTGRYLAVFAGLLMLLGVWLLVRRLRGPWWAAAALWVFAFNPSLIKIYSVGVSQVLVSCMLAWCLYFALGANRTNGQLVAAALLAAAAWYTRINMAPLLFLLIAYIYWQHGPRKALIAGAAGFGFMLLGHLLYWPEVLKIWAYWLPRPLSGFLDPWRLGADAVRRWNPEITLLGRLNSFVQTLQTNLIFIVGVVAGVLLWPYRRKGIKDFERKSLLFVLIVFLSLFLIHAFVTLSSEYCVYCLQVYSAFFNVAALVFLIGIVWYWDKPRPTWVNTVSIVLILLIGAGVGYSVSKLLSGDWLAPRWVRSLLDLRFVNGVELNVLIQNKYGASYNEAVNLARRFILHTAPVLAGLLIAAAALLFARRPWTWLPKKRRPDFHYAARAWSAFLLIALVFSATPIAGSGFTTYDCNVDVIASYETVGAELRRLIPAGARVYWTGGDSAVPLLYISNVQLFPAQINDGYSFYLSGDSAAIERFSYWDDSIATKWQGEADYMLIEDRFYDPYWVDSGDWAEIGLTSPADACREGASIHVLQHLR
jgi:hypothetical protein